MLRASGSGPRFYGLRSRASGLGSRSAIVRVGLSLEV